ncbi:EZH inhibitory protein [Phyllostomus hastatus]|uniref:EZH inhibitory protein n=1 Tax=Phyllostomus hastatus TaxID=9423 RepID=UPI001E684F78|nr:EZH inhibitory protein [Phyllostomus hastatus]
MATQSHLEKEQKQQQGEGPTGPKNEVIAAPGDALGTGHGDAGPSVPTVWSVHGLERPVSIGAVPPRHQALSCEAAPPCAALLPAASVHPRQGPDVHRRASEPGPACRPRSASASTAASARGPAPSSRHASAPPRCAVPNHTSRLGTALHSPGSAPGPARRRCATPAGPARRRCAIPVGPARQRCASTPGSSGHSRRAPRPGGGLGRPASAPSPASPPALRSSSTTAGFVSRSRPTQRSSSSSSPNFDDLASISAPSPASLRRALLLEFDALSPASPGEQAEIQSIPDSPTPPPAFQFTGPLPLPPNFRGSASMATPSPATLTQALLLEFDDLSPVSSGEQAEVESTPLLPCTP